MGDTSGSERGASAPGSTRAAELAALAERYGERARLRGLQQTSETQASLSAAGERRAGILVDRRLRNCGVPEVYAAAKWERVLSPAVRVWCAGIDARTTKDRGATANWGLIGHGMLITGPTGTGKSSAAALVCREALQIDRQVWWSYVPDLQDSLTLSAASRTREMDRQKSARLVVWDDFGVRDLADWEVGYLDQIVEARYRQRLPMLVTTNRTPADLRADLRLGRMLDRWRERTCSVGVTLNGQSMREPVPTVRV